MTEINTSAGGIAETFSNNIFDLWVLMDRARLTINRTCNLELAAYGLNTEQAGILDTLLRSNGSATIAEIVDATAKQYNSVTTLVNRMVNTGLLEKTRSSKNGRFLVSMTDKGKSIYGNLTRNAVEMAFSELTNEEKQVLYVILKKLLKKGRQMLGIDFKMPFLPSRPEELRARR